MAVQVDVVGGTDVAGFAFTFTRVNCAGETVPPTAPVTVIKDLEDVLLDSSIPAPGNPAAGASQHGFSDAFVPLAPGCYDVDGQPIRIDGTPSQDCSAAHAKHVRGTLATPQIVPGLSNITLIAAGGYTSMARGNGNFLWGLGYGDYGQIGNGLGTSTSTPAAVAIPNPSALTQISGGYYHFVALRNNGDVWSWGYNGNGEVGNGGGSTVITPALVLGNAKSITAGENHSLAVDANGVVHAWGYNAYGQLGDGSTANSAGPVAISVNHAVSVAAGYVHSLALLDNGTVVAWGYNGYGQIGNGTVIDTTTPVSVLNLDQVVAIAAGGYSSMALRSDGTVWVWGSTLSGSLPVPVPVSFP